MRLPSLLTLSLRASTYLAAGVLVFASTSDEARACGGCFHEAPRGPTQTPSVVTDHRMVLALSSTTTTLWDQVQYEGDPAGFAWVLPIRGKVQIGVGDQGFIDALDQKTAPVIGPAKRTCTRVTPGKTGTPTTYEYSGGGEGGGGIGIGCGGASSDSVAVTSTRKDGSDATPEKDNSFTVGPEENPGVVVTNASVVGPYQSVQVHGSDPGSIVGWLRAHDYVVPTELEPILARYVTEGFDFLAVRLRPKAGVRAMRPIRVSYDGAYATLPLRMVRAGVGENVGIKLFVIGDGRWRTKNIPTFTILPGDLTWDHREARSDYVATRTKRAAAFGNRAFALESSIDFLQIWIPEWDPPPPQLPPDAGSKDAATKDAASAETDSTVAEASDADAATDVDDAVTDASPTDSPGDASPDAASGVGDLRSDAEVAFGSLPSRRVTRLRADLPASALDVDLELEADDDQSLASTQLVLSNTTHWEYICPPTPPPSSTTPSTDPTSSTYRPAQSSTTHEGGCGCLVAGGRDRKPLRAPIGIAVLAAFATVVRRVTRTRGPLPGR